MLLTPVLIIHHATKYGKVWLLALPCQPVGCQESITKTREKGEKHFSWDFSFSAHFVSCDRVSNWLGTFQESYAGCRKPQGPTCLLLRSAGLVIAPHHTEHLCVLWDPIPAQEALEQLSHAPPTTLLQQTTVYGYADPKGKIFPTNCAWDLDISPQESGFWP